MQTVGYRLYNIISSRPKLLAIITVVIIAILTVPVILPHIRDTSTIYHIILHVASLIIAVFLGAVSILAYIRNGRSRLLFMMFAFLSLSVIEAMYLFNVSTNIEDIVIPGLDRSITSDFLVTLTLFGLGIFRVKKYQ